MRGAMRGDVVGDKSRRDPGHFQAVMNQCSRCGVRSGPPTKLSDGSVMNDTVKLRTWCRECTPHYACDGCDEAHRKEVAADR